MSSLFYILFIKKSLSFFNKFSIFFCVFSVIFVVYVDIKSTTTIIPPIIKISSALPCPLLSIFCLNMCSVVKNCIPYINYIVFCLEANITCFHI